MQPSQSNSIEIYLPDSTARLGLTRETGESKFQSLQRWHGLEPRKRASETHWLTFARKLVSAADWLAFHRKRACEPYSLLVEGWLELFSK